MHPVMGERMNRKGQMRWSLAGANALLHVRRAAPNGLDVPHFKRRYPPHQRLSDLLQFAGA